MKNYIILLITILFTSGCVSLSEKEAESKILAIADNQEGPSYSNKEIKNGHFYHYVVCNYYQTLPKEILAFTKLKRLTISFNKEMTSIPEFINKYDSLYELNIIYNSVTKIEDNALKIPTLKDIDFSNNLLEDLPSSISSLDKLEELDLSKNKFTTFPKEILNLTNLKVLNLSKNQLSSLPEEIGNLENLEELYLRGNPITELPDSFKNLKKLKILWCDDSKLKNFPKMLCEMTSLEEILINGEDMTLPKEIDQLQNLNWITLNDGIVDNLPISLGSLSNLENLHFKNCDLSKVTFHASFRNLDHLRMFKIENGNINAFPSFITDLDSLRILGLKGNKGLVALHEGLSNCSILEALTLDHNSLKSLPSDVGHIKKLHYLNIEGNRLTTLPVSLRYNKANLAILYYGNPWQWLPKELVDNFETNTGRGLPPGEVR
ncbi:leucine-rich repeat domain-containing protein [Flammeovirga kamogawensis]|uniref:Leucine-rich repeat domain-containing protein n=1 Tax=Flammeovirga kamogawensis TaxID=373891 RepID=A0ABX8H4N3_9BACT|nr:leucine-rich repeat domain-containing protein [Flammeovirga kamogawensis]MBB6460506.1 Leucine-rich repeat (LRR) protein [Flammeovirga kamogawensis]QWG10312.1 leucine-rich repeat domain-containing protein [Flammeovirga kamogawensis]TRX64759.1 leucine-rich repeat protein [Flammeovirga kamogawensis]